MSIFFNFNIQQAGRIEPPSGPVLAHAPYVWLYITLPDGLNFVVEIFSFARRQIYNKKKIPVYFNNIIFFKLNLYLFYSGKKVKINIISNKHNYYLFNIVAHN